MTVIASGDSMTVGVGEKDFKINPGSWVKYYCQMTGKKMVPIAKNGTTTSSYIKTQLPYIISQRPVVYRDWETDRKSTRLNSSHSAKSRMPSSA